MLSSQQPPRHIITEANQLVSFFRLQTHQEPYPQHNRTSPFDDFPKDTF